jgi:hypothetical protein
MMPQARERGQQLQRWLRIKLQTRQGRLGGCSESVGYYSVFSATCKDTLTHRDYVQCVETKMFLGWDRHDPGGIALACWPGENFGSPQRIETGSAGVSGTALISGLGRTSYENIIEPCRALNSRSPVDRVAERHGSLANRNHQPASQHHGRGAKAGGEAGGETTAAGATGKHGCSSPDIASLSSATDISTKAGARFSDGGDCRA